MAELNKCGDCVHYPSCAQYVERDETFPEIEGGCKLFKREADFVKVKHGKWLKRGNEKRCSECGFIYYSNNDDWTYCPNCSARMDEGKG